MSRGLIDATGVVTFRGPQFACARAGHRRVIADVARGGLVCFNCGVEWCDGRQHVR